MFIYFLLNRSRCAGEAGLQSHGTLGSQGSFRNMKSYILELWRSNGL